MNELLVSAEWAAVGAVVQKHVGGSAEAVVGLAPEGPPGMEAAVHPLGVEVLDVGDEQDMVLVVVVAADDVDGIVDEIAAAAVEEDKAVDQTAGQLDTAGTAVGTREALEGARVVRAAQSYQRDEMTLRPSLGTEKYVDEADEAVVAQVGGLTFHFAG